MPKFCNVGMATSARQVVGLHEPPKNTSGVLLQSVGLSSSLLPCFIVAAAEVVVCSLDEPLNETYALSFRDVVGSGHCVRKRFKSAANTQNSPNVKPFIWRLLNAVARSKPLFPRRANNLAVCNISLTENNGKANAINNDRKYKVIAIFNIYK